MSPESYRQRLSSLLRDMYDLYKAASDNPVLGRSLLHLNRSAAVLENRRVTRSEDRKFYGRGQRNYIPRAIAILKKHKKPITLNLLLAKLKEEHPDLWDIQYRTFHPVIRNEVRSKRRRVVECRSTSGYRLYGLPGWKTAQGYRAKPKYGVQSRCRSRSK